MRLFNAALVGAVIFLIVSTMLQEEEANLEGLSEAELVRLLDDVDTRITELTAERDSLQRELDDLRGVELGRETGPQIVAEPRGVADQHVRVLDGELEPLGQRRARVVVLDLRDEALVETLLLCTCKAEVPSNAAVDHPRVADAADLLGRLVEDAFAPQHAVEVVERREELGLPVEQRCSTLGHGNAHRSS